MQHIKHFMGRPKWDAPCKLESSGKVSLYAANKGRRNFQGKEEGKGHYSVWSQDVCGTNMSKKEQGEK